MTYLEAQKQRQIGIINNTAAKQYQLVVGAFPTHELITWALQMLEANGVMPLQTITAIAAAEGIEESVVVARVKAQGQSFMAVAGGIVGKRLRLIAQVNAITDENPDEPSEEAILAISEIVW